MSPPAALSDVQGLCMPLACGTSLAACRCCGHPGSTAAILELLVAATGAGLVSPSTLVLAFVALHLGSRRPPGLRLPAGRPRRWLAVPSPQVTRWRLVCWRLRARGGVTAPQCRLFMLPVRCWAASSSSSSSSRVRCRLCIYWPCAWARACCCLRLASGRSWRASSRCRVWQTLGRGSLQLPWCLR